MHQEYVSGLHLRKTSGGRKDGPIREADLS
jgi:hypothetical protein